MPTVDPTARVHQSAQLESGVHIGAGVVIEEQCHIGADTTIEHHSIIWSHSKIGKRNRIFPFCSIGGEPQDKKYKGEKTHFIMGDDNTVREYCFFNKGTLANEKTVIGHRNWIMAYVHIAHDCIIGHDNIFSNLVQLAGHVKVDNQVVIGGGSLCHQFRHIGSGAMIGGGEKIRSDIPPWALIADKVVATNKEGLKRTGYSAEVIAKVRHAYQLLYRKQLSLSDAIQSIADLNQAEQTPPLLDLLNFLSNPNLQLIRPKD